MPPGKVIDVAAGLVFRQGKLLITQRRPGDHLGGLWEFPGGKLEEGETYPSCLIRELREELGVEVVVGRELEDLTHPYPEKTIHIKFFVCELTSGEARPIHCHALAWVGSAELSQYEFPAADARLLARLQQKDAFEVTSQAAGKLLGNSGWGEAPAEPIHRRSK